LILFTSIADILQHLKKQWASLFKNFLQGQQLATSAKKPKVEIHENFEEFKEKLKFVGITKLTQENVNLADSIIELIKKLGGSIEDHGTDFKVSVSGNTINVGKSVIKILDSELRSIKSI